VPALPNTVVIMQRYKEPTSQIGVGFSSIFLAMEGHARDMNDAQHRRFIEIRDGYGKLRTCLIEIDPEPFDVQMELPNEIALIESLLNTTRHRHNAISLINGIGNGLLGQRGHAFMNELVAGGYLSAARLDAIRHVLWYDMEHPQSSPSMDEIRHGAAALLPVLLTYAKRQRIDLSRRTCLVKLQQRIMARFCPLIRRAGLKGLCAEGFA
jgi:hypothetical protein